MGVWIETIREENDFVELKVTPCVGVWIETYELRNAVDYGTVTPCVGVWIETSDWFTRTVPVNTSHPAWVCGLKLCVCQWYIP